MTDPGPPPHTAAPAPPKRAALTKDLSEFLIELSIALHKHAIYPDGHPSLQPAAAAVVRRAAVLLESRQSLSLGVARDQLVIEGVATDPKHPVLGELAGRLHRHHLGAVSFYRGIETGEIYGLLRTLAVEADRTGRPLGLGPPEQLRRWPHAQLHPLTYDRLELMDESDRTPLTPTDEELDEGGGRRVRGAQLWIGLARAALAGQLAEDEPPPTQPAVIARAIDEHPKAEGYDQVVVGYLLQIADELRSAGGESALELRRRTARLIRELKPETLQRLIDMGGDVAQREQFVLNAADGMAVDAVVDIVKAAAEASQQNISHSLVRLLNKLAAHAEAGPASARAIADAGLRDQVKRLLSGWRLEDPNPVAYGAALQRLSQARPVFAVLADPATLPESERLVQMALELGSVGPMVWRAVDELAGSGKLAAVLDLVDAADPDGDRGAAAAAIRERVATPEQVRWMIEAEPPDLDLLDRLLAVTGTQAADVLLDALAVSTSRTLRRALLERLGRFGLAIAPNVFARLDDGRWYVVRNLLALMEEWSEYPVEFSAVPYAIHPDHRVRRQALKLQLRLATEHDQAVPAALADPDASVVAWGLLAAQPDPPPGVVPFIVRHAQPDASPELRPLALKALGRCRDPEALDTLLSATAGGRSLLGRARLSTKSRELLVALRALAEGWAHDPRAADVLARAARASDPEIRAAAGAGGAP